MAVFMRAAATDVEEAIVPGSGHWVMEENPAAIIALVTGFLSRDGAPRAAARDSAARPAGAAAAAEGEIQLTSAEIDSGAARSGAHQNRCPPPSG